MADDDKKPKGGGAPNTGDMIGILLGVLLLFMVVQRVYIFIRTAFIEGGGPERAEGVFGMISDLTFWWKIFAVLVSAVFLAGIFHVRARFMALVEAENNFYFPKGASDTVSIPIQVDSRWDRVVAHADTDNPNDWKVAILEADIILGDLLDHLGYEGDSIGEKLKRIEKSDFVTLDKAWEAHKIRNAIAHEGSQFLINHREVLRVLELYKDVFDEFYYV